LKTLVSVREELIRELKMRGALVPSIDTMLGQTSFDVIAGGRVIRVHMKDDGPADGFKPDRWMGGREE
jgi:hypothetical protein